MKVLYIPVLFFVFCPVKTNPPVEHILISSSRTPLILLFTRRKERAVSKKLAQREAPRAIAATAVVALLRNVLELAKFSHFCADFSRSRSPWFPLRKRQGRDGRRFRVLWCRASHLVCGCFPAKKKGRYVFPSSSPSSRAVMPPGDISAVGEERRLCMYKYTKEGSEEKDTFQYSLNSKEKTLYQKFGYT